MAVSLPVAAATAEVASHRSSQAPSEAGDTNPFERNVHGHGLNTIQS